MKFRKYKYALLTAIFSFCLWFIFISNYIDEKLGGEKDLVILNGKMFGAPQYLIKEGLNFAYTQERETGWDGQFHYYITHDLLNKKETSKSIDNPPYRYNRPGIGILIGPLLHIFNVKILSPYVFTLIQGLTVSLGSYFGFLALSEIYEKNGFLILL
jgi:hypothetical protein